MDEKQDMDTIACLYCSEEFERGNEHLCGAHILTCEKHPAARCLALLRITMLELVSLEYVKDFPEKRDIWDAVSDFILEADKYIEKHTPSKKDGKKEENRGNGPG